MMITFVISLLCLVAGLVLGMGIRGYLLHEDLKAGVATWGGETFTVVAKNADWRTRTPPPAKPAEDPGAARIISIVRQAIASGQMDVELAHTAANRARIVRRAMREDPPRSTLDKKV